MKKVIFFIFALLLFLCVSSFGMAFNNHRRGFIIGGLGGVSLNIGNEVKYNLGTERDEVQQSYGVYVTLHTDFRIGGGFKGDKLMLYFWNVGNWWRKDGVITIRRITGSGMSYYFKPTSPSLYVNAGIGWAWGFNNEYYSQTLHDETVSTWWNVGFMGGFGYEFAPHWSFEVGFMYANPPNYENEWGTEIRTNAFTVSLSIIGIAY
jgi:hypothetical protein